MGQAELLEILQILAKYTGNQNEFSFHDYTLHLSPDHNDIPEPDTKRLSELGATWDEDSECWTVLL
jgi:hypothetical protein